MAQAIKFVDDLVGAIVRSRNRRERLLCEAVHDGQDPERALVEEAVGHEVRSPDFVRAAGLRTARAISAGAPPPGRPRTDRQAFLALKPIRAFLIDLPTFAAKQHVQPPVAVANPRLGQLLEPLAQRRLWIAARPVAMRRAIEAACLNGPPFANAERGLEPPAMARRAEGLAPFV